MSHRPEIQFTAPITVPPPQIITGDEADKARRKSIREKLGEFLTEADEIYNSPCNHTRLQPELSQDEQAACKKRKAALDGKVEHYLRANLDSSYLVRFKYGEQMGWGGGAVILTEFLTELKN